MDYIKTFPEHISMNIYMIKIVESLAILLLYIIIQFLTKKLIGRSAIKFEYQPARVYVFKKLMRLILLFIISIIILAIWGVDQAEITLFLSSMLTVLGIAFFAQWSILSNITSSIIIFFNHPISIGDSLTIMDKDFQVEGEISDIGIFFITIKSTTNEYITVPSSVLMQKMIKRNTQKNS